MSGRNVLGHEGGAGRLNDVGTGATLHGRAQHLIQFFGEFDFQLDVESIYKNFVRVIERVNVVVSNFAQPDMGDVELDPTKGNVAFGSGKDCWGFTLKGFADLYSKKFGIASNELMKKFWGDNYYDAKAKVWRTEDRDKDGNQLKKAFVKFIMEPIVKAVSEGKTYTK